MKGRGRGQKTREQTRKREAWRHEKTCCLKYLNLSLVSWNRKGLSNLWRETSVTHLRNKVKNSLSEDFVTSSESLKLFHIILPYWKLLISI